MSNILKSYLVALGLKDNFSQKLDSTIKKNSNTITKFSKSFVKAGTFVSSMFLTANVGAAKFLGNLVKTDDEVGKFAKKLGVSREEAFKVKTALDAMGKTMDEVAADPKLVTMFKKLQEDADKMQPPDFSDGLNQVRDIQLEFKRLRQSGTYAIQWIGHYTLKYLQQPLEKVKNIFGGLNDGIIKNIPKWADKVGYFMAGIVKLGITVVRGATDIFNAVKRIFDMIPKELKMTAGAIAAFGILIRAGPIGILVALLSAALLLLDDVYTYLDGGDALLGNIWRKISDLWKVFNDSGGLEKTKGLIDAVGRLLTELIKPLGIVRDENATVFAGTAQAGLEWFVTQGLPKYIDRLSAIVSVVTKVVSKMNEWGITQGVLKGIFAGFTAMKIGNTIAGIAKSFSGLKKTVDATGKATGGILKFLKLNPFMIWVIAIGALIAILSVLFKNKDKVGEFINGIKDKIKEFLGTAKDTIKDIVAMIPEFVGIGLELLNSLIDTVAENLPMLLDAGISILMSLIDGIVKSIPKILPAVVIFINKLLTGIAKYLPKIVDAGVKILTEVINGIAKVLPTLAEAAVKIITTVLSAILDNLPTVINTGVDLLTSLIDGIISVLPALIDAAITLITTILDTILENLPMILDAGLEILMTLIEAIVDNIDTIIDAAIQIIIALVSGLIKAIPKIVAAIPKILTAILNGLNKILPKIMNLGKDIVKKLWDGLFSMGSWITDKVSGFFGDIFGGIGDFFGGLFGGKDNDKPDKTPKSPESGGYSGHADGGIFDKEHTAQFAEGNKPEAVIPLTKPKRAREILSGVAHFMGKGADMLGTIDRGLNQSSTVLNNETNNSTVNNNNSFDMRTSYTIHDTSGRPESTASAIERTDQTKIRNLKTILNT